MAESGRVYLAPIPGEALELAGKCRFAVDGYISGKRMRSVYSELVVKPAGGGASTAEEPTPSQAEQLQTQIDTVLEHMQEQAARARDAAAVGQSAAAASAEEAVACAGSASAAANAAAAAQSALGGVQTAIANIPAGSTPIVNDLTTGGAALALSAEMGKLLGRRPNPNLLDNWYFPDPIDQRGGHFVPAGVDAYSDPELTTAVSQPTAPKMVEVTDSYAVYTTTSGEPRYVSLSDVRRGYCGARYMLDRWQGITSASGCEITGSGVKFLPGYSGNYSMISQIIEGPEQYLGKTVTLSILYASGTFRTATAVLPEAFPSAETTLCTLGITTLRLSATKLRVVISAASTSAGAEYVAMKLELGSAQTLAHQDENGVWVLNDPPPNPQQELAKCQRYQWVIESTAGALPIAYAVAAGLNVCNFILRTPVPMAKTPTITNGASVTVHKASDGSTITDIPGVLKDVLRMDTNRDLIHLRFWPTDPTALTSGELYRVRVPEGAQLIFDANL